MDVVFSTINQPTDENLFQLRKFMMSNTDKVNNEIVRKVIDSLNIDDMTLQILYYNYNSIVAMDYILRVIHKKRDTYTSR